MPSTGEGCVLTQEENDRLTAVAPGTRMGDLLRRYWHPIAAIAELEADPVRPVRVLGEDLTLFQSESGEVGLLADRCAHRCLSLAFGIPWKTGLRCAYHGWTYNAEGQVVEMPFEPACLPLRIKAYPVQELSGAIWAYLGPQPAPLLPRWDLLVRTDVMKHIRTDVLPCNWLQCVDNTLDPVHFEHLHGVYGNYVMKRMGRPPMLNPARHMKIDFDLFEYGIYKRRLLEGESEDSPDWTIGHPIIFPHILVVPTARGESSMVYRVPIDNTHTLSLVITGSELKAGEVATDRVPVVHEPLIYDDLGRVAATHVGRQDELVFIGQGPIADRTTEHLGTSDKGLLLFRQLLFESLQKVERGEDPISVIRDPSVNEPMIQVHRGTERLGFHLGVSDEHWGGAGKATPQR